MMSHIYAIPPLIASLGNLFLGGLVLGKNQNSKLHRVWALFSLCLAIWSFGFFIIYLSPTNKETALFWNKFYSVGMVLIPAVYLQFALTLTGNKSNRWQAFSRIVYFYSLAIVLSIPTVLFNKGVTLMYWGYSPVRGLTGHIYDIGFPLILITAFYVLIKGLKQTTGRARAQIKIVIFASSIGFGLGLTNFFPLYGIRIYPLGHIGNFAANIMIVYSIVKYAFLDFEVIVRKSALYSILTAFIGAVYVSSVFIFQTLFQQLTGYKSIFPAMTVAIIIAVTFEPLRRSVQLLIDRYFFKKKYEYQQIISTSSENLRTITQPIAIASFLIETVTNAIQPTCAWLMLYDPKNGYYSVAAAYELSPKNQITLRFTNDSALVEHLVSKAKYLETEDLEKVFKRRDDKTERAQLMNLGTKHIIPVMSKEKLLGMLFLGRKKSEEAYGQDDFELLTTLANQAAISFENSQLYDDLQASYLNTVRSLVTALEAKDEYTKGHSERVANYAKDIALEFGFSKSEAQLLYEVSLLHDVGKIGISEQILNKPTKLSAREFEQIQSHTVIGERILSGIEALKTGLSAVRHHHERLNGEGYPDGLSQIDIPLPAKILAVADAFDAMTSQRPYRPAMSQTEAIAELKRHACEQFDPKVVRAFISVLAREDVGKTLHKSRAKGKPSRHLKSA